MCDELIEVLRLYKKQSFFKYGDKLPKYVFPGISPEDQLAIASYNNAIKKCTKGIEVEKGFVITGHTFRHTFITNLVKEKVSIKDIVAYTKISERVLQEYTHLTEGDVEYVGDIINNIYFRKERKDTSKVYKKISFTRYENGRATLRKKEK